MTKHSGALMSSRLIPPQLLPRKRTAVDELVDVFGIHLEVDAVDVGEAFEQNRLAFHHRLRRQRARDCRAPAPPCRWRSPPRYCARGVVVGDFRGLLDFQTRNGDAGRVGERQIVRRRQRLGRLDFELPRLARAWKASASAPVICVVAVDRGIAGSASRGVLFKARRGTLEVRPLRRPAAAEAGGGGAGWAKGSRARAAPRPPPRRPAGQRRRPAGRRRDAATADDRANISTSSAPTPTPSCSTAWATSTRCSSTTPCRRAAALDIALTRRGRHEGRDIPMCGVPVHNRDPYLERLIRGRLQGRHLRTDRRPRRSPQARPQSRRRARSRAPGDAGNTRRGRPARGARKQPPRRRRPRRRRLGRGVARPVDRAPSPSPRRPPARSRRCSRRSRPANSSSPKPWRRSVNSPNGPRTATLLPAVRFDFRRRPNAACARPGASRRWRRSEPFRAPRPPPPARSSTISRSHRKGARRACPRRAASPTARPWPSTRRRGATLELMRAPRRRAPRQPARRGRPHAHRRRRAAARRAPGRPR